MVELGDGVSKLKNGNEVYSDIKKFEAGNCQQIKGKMVPWG